MLDGVYPADAEHLERILAETRILRAPDRRPAHAVAGRDGQPAAAPRADRPRRPRSRRRGRFRATPIARAWHSPSTCRPTFRHSRSTRSACGRCSRTFCTNALQHTPDRARSTCRRGGDNEVGRSPSATPAAASRPTARTDLRSLLSLPDSPGSGLGLAIAASLVEAHGGTITATSDAGPGVDDIGRRLPRDREQRQLPGSTPPRGRRGPCPQPLSPSA